MEKARLKQLSYIPYVQECSGKHEHIEEKYKNSNFLKNSNSRNESYKVWNEKYAG